MVKQAQITINHLQHVGIPVTDLHKSELFYERLGFNNVMQSGFTTGEGAGDCLMMNNNLLVIELYQLPPRALQDIRSRQNGHIDHIAFDVDDIDLAFEQLKTASFNIIEEAPVFLSFWKKGCRYFNITGPDGERLEFNQILL